MNEQPSPTDQLANVYDSLADDVFDGQLETDEEINQRAFRIARAAIEKALGTGTQESPPANDTPPSREVSETLRRAGTAAREVAERGLDSAGRGLAKVARRIAGLFHREKTLK